MGINMKLNLIIKSERKASYTIEAAYIIPILFFIVLLFLYLNFYLHDRSIFIARINELAEDYQETKEEYIIEKSYVEQRLTENLWMSEIENVEVKVSKTKISIKAKLSLSIPNNGIYHLFLVAGFSYETEKEKWLLERSETARILTSGTEMLGKIKGVSELIEKIKPK